MTANATTTKQFSLLAILGLALGASSPTAQAQVAVTLTGPAQAASCGQVLVTNRFVNNGQTVAGLWITNELPSSSYAYVTNLSTVTLPGGIVWTNGAAEPTTNNNSTNLVWDFSAVVTPAVITNLLITEVFYNMANTTFPKASYEWFELYNPTTNSVVVNGWMVKDANPGKTNALPNFTIAAGEFVIIAGQTNAFLEMYPGYSNQLYEVEGGVIGSGLNVTPGDGVILLNAASNRVDAVSYGGSTAAFSPGVNPVGEGHSIERNPANNDTNKGSDWKDQASPNPGSGSLPVGIQKGGAIEIVYAVAIDCGATSGQLFSRAGFEQPPGMTNTASGSMFLTVNTPDLVVTKNPIMQSKGVGDEVTWTVRVENAGFGPAANVVAVDTIGAGFVYTGFSVDPSTKTVTNATWNSTQIPAFASLAAGDHVDIVVTGVVVACDLLYNRADAMWGCGEQVCENTAENDQTATAGIQFIQRYPNVTVSLSPDPLTVDYCSGGEVTLTVTNTAGPGVGRVDDFKFIPTLPTGWTVTGATVAVNGDIEVGQLMPGTGTNITVWVVAGGACPIALTPQGIYFKPDYFDCCGNSYSGPLLAELATVVNKPGASVTKIMDSTITGDGTFPVRVELAYTNFSGSESITVTDLYPFPTHTNLTVTNFSTGGTRVGNAVVWTNGSLSGTGVVTSSFDIVIAEPCGGPSGLDYNVLHATSFRDCKGCEQAVVGDGFRYPIRFQQSGCPGTGGCSFASSKNVSAELTEVCDPVIVTHTFSAISGTNIVNWTNMIFTANLAGGDGVLPSTNDVAVFVDGTNYSSRVSITGESSALMLDLSGLDGSLSPSPTNVTSLEISYKVSVSEPGQYSDNSSLFIPGCGARGDDVFWNVGKSRMEIDLEQIFIAEACGRVPGSIDLRMLPSPEGVSGTNALFPAYDVVVTLDMDFSNVGNPGFSYITNSTTFSNIVDLATGNPIAPSNPDILSNQLTWTLGNLQASTNMSIHYLLRPSCSSNTNEQRRAEVDYNNRCGDGTNAVSQTNVEPYFVSASLINTLQPQVQFLTDTQIVNQIRILNTGDPDAYNLYIEMDLPPGVSFGSAGIPPTSWTANAGTTNQVIWDLHEAKTNYPGFPLFDDDLDGSYDDLRAREVLEFWVTNYLDSCTGDNTLKIRSSHGCKGDRCGQAPEATAAFVRNLGSLITRATFPTQSELCSSNPVTYSIRNSGLAIDYDVQAFQTLPLGASYVANSCTVSINGGETNLMAVNPTGTGVEGAPLTWTSANIPLLAAMPPTNEVTIGYYVNLGCEVALDNQQFKAQGQFMNLCGDIKTNTAVVTVLAPLVPLLVVEKSADVDAADLGQEVVYTVTISHDALSAAGVPYLTLTDVLPTAIDFVGASVTPDSISGQTLFWSSTNLNAQTVDGTAPFALGETITIYVTGTVINCDSSVINWATVNYGCPGDPCLSASNSASIVTTPVLTPPGLVSEMTLTTCGGTKTTTITNSGASATNVVLTEYAPPGYIFTAAKASGGAFTADPLVFSPIGLPAGSIATVDFNTLQLGKNSGFTVTWTLASTGENLDCLADPTDLDYKDPKQADPTSLTSSNRVAYLNLCSEPGSVTGSNSAYPGMPDLDIDLQPNSQIVTNGEVVNFTVSVLNRSETTDAEGIYVRVKMGTGWTNLLYISNNIVSSGPTTMYTDSQGTNLLFDFPGVKLNPLADKIEIFFSAEATQNGGNLDVYAEVVGNCGNPLVTPSCTFTNTLGWPAFADTMTTTAPMKGPVNGQYYSFDQDRFVAAGHSLSKTVRYNEEGPELAGTNRNARVGEDLFYRIEARYFGGAFSDVRITDSLPKELAFGTPTNYAFSGGITGAVWNAGTSNFTLQPSILTTNPSTFVVDLPVVVSNRMDVQDGVIITNTATTDFALAGFTNVPIERTTEVEIFEPVLQITKTVNASLVQEGDIIIFTNRLVHTGASRTSAYSVVFTDNLPAGLVFHDFISPATGDAVVGGTTVSFNSTHWAALSEFKTNDAPIDFVFSVLVTNQIVGVTMTNRSQATYVSLDSASTNGNERTGADGTNGLNNYTTTSQVAVTTRAIGGLTKTYVSSSQTNTLTNGTTNDWTIGERFIYEIKVDVPQGVVSNLVLTDVVPVGIDWVGTNPDANMAFPGRGYEFFISPGGPQFPTNIADGLVIDDDDPTPEHSTTTDGSGQPVVFKLGTFTNAVDGYFTLKLEFVALNLPLNVGTNPAPRRGSNVVTAVDTVTTLGATGPVYRIVEHDVRALKTRSSATNDAGDVITFTVVASNQVNALANAYNVLVTDLLSSNVYDLSTFQFVSVTPGWTTNLIGTVGGQRYEMSTVGDTALRPGTGAIGVFRVALAQGVRPNQIYTNRMDITKSSTLSNLPPVGIVDRQDTANNSVTFRVPGLAIAKTLESTSETNIPPDPTNSFAQIGEVLTYRLAIILPESTITNLTVRDTISSNGLAYVYGSARLDTNTFEGSTGAFTVSPPFVVHPLAPMGQAMTFAFANVVVTSNNIATDNTFYVLLDYLVLDNPANIGLTGNQTVHTNQATLTYGSNPGGAVTSAVVTTTVVEPVLQIFKSLTPTNQVDAGDVISVTLMVTNSGTATAYDVVIEDLLNPNYFNPLSLASVVSPTGFVHEAGIAIRFISDTNAPTGTNTIEAGESLVFTFDVQTAISLPPNTTVTNWATVAGDSLASTNIWDVQRPTGGTNSATFTADDFEPLKTLIATSETRLADSTGNDLQIGEMATYEISVGLPEGTITDLQITDIMPAGMAYVVDSLVVITNELEGTLATPPTVTPNVAPLGNSGQNVVITWVGDTVMNATTNLSGNILRLRLSAVVLDLPGNAGLTPQTVLTNQASVTYAGNPNPPAVVDGPPVTLIEPDVSITKTVSPDSGDAGDTVTVTLVATNSGLATAYDLYLSDLLDGTIFDTGSVAEGTTPVGFTFAQTPSGTDALVTYLSDSLAGYPDNTLEVGESLDFVFTVNLAQTVVPGAIYTNGVTLLTDTIYETNNVGIQRPYTNTAQDTLTISNMFIAKAFISTSENGPVDTIGTNVTIGETATYRLTVTLPEATITNLTVTDVIPAGMSFFPGSVGVDDGGFTGSLPGARAVTTGGGSGDDVTITFEGLTVVTDNNDGTDNSFDIWLTLLVLDETGNDGLPADVDGNGTTVLPNSATVAYDGNPPVSTSTVVNVNVVEPLLAITKTMSYIGNNEVRVDLVVSNRGLATAFDVEIQDVLTTNWWDTTAIGADTPPDGFNISVGPGPGDATVRIYSDSASGQPTNSIEVGEALTFRLYTKLIDGAPSPVTNRAVVTEHSTIDGPNPDERDEPDVEDEDELGIPSYSLTKVRTYPTGRAAAVGETVRFDLIVTNTGPIGLDPVLLEDRYDTNYLSFVAIQPGLPASVDNDDDGTINWTNVGPLASSQSVTVAVEFVAIKSTLLVGPTTNWVVAAPFTTNGLPLPPKANEAPVDVVYVGYTLEKTNTDPGPTNAAQVGDPIEFTITVVNTGEVALVTVPVVDTYDTNYLIYVEAVPPSFDNTNDGTINWTNIGPLAAGASKQIVATFTAAASTLSQPQTNWVETTPTTPSNAPSVDPKTTNAPYRISRAGYELTKTNIDPGPGNATQVGDFITFLIAITNTGDVVLENIAVTDTYDPWLLDFEDAVPQQTSSGGGEAYWAYIGPLPVGGSTNITARFLARNSTESQPKTNTVVATPTTPPGEPEVAPKTNEAPYKIADASYTLVKERTSPTNRPAIIGETVTFQITVTNTGDVELETVPVEDTYETTYLTYVSSVPASVNNTNDGTINWTNIGPLAVGDSTQIIATFTAATDTLGTNHTNVVVTMPTTPTNAPPVPPQTNVAPYAVDTPASLGDFVWLDVNGDGIQGGAGETGMPDVVVTLYDATDVVIGTTTTDVYGAYAFTNLPPGDYSVGFVPQAGYAITLQNQGTNNAVNSDADPVTGRTTTITLASGDNDLTWDAGIYLPASLGNFVWEDINGDGVQYIGEEPGIAGVTVELYDAATNLVGTTLTDTNGWYDFTGLIPGDYVVKFVRPAGYRFTQQNMGGDDALDSDADPTTGQTTTITLVSGQNDPDWDAGLYLPASVGDYVWLDENWDGVQDPGEAGIPNVQMQLLNSTGTVVATTLTDVNGLYLFSDLPPGIYTVRVNVATLPAGLAANQTHDLDGTRDHQTNVGLPSGAAFRDADFGYNWRPPNSVLGAIGDRVWVDANADGAQDPGEPGIPNVRMQLYVDSNGDGIYNSQLASVLTDASGFYIFTNLPAGAYQVRVATNTLPAGYVQSGDPDHFGTNATANPTQAGDHRTTAPVVLAPGDVFVNADFGYLPPTFSNLGDLIYFDANANGVFNPAAGDYGIPGVTVALLNAAGKVIASTVTDSTGWYLFTGLPAGTYTVWVNDSGHVLENLVQTGDPDGGLDSRSTAILDGRRDNLLQDHGYTPDGHGPLLGLIGDTIFLDRDNNRLPGLGEGLQGVTVGLYDETGLFLLATTTTDANGRYYFGGLPAASYVVRVDTSTLPNGGGGLVNTVDPDTLIGPGDSISVLALDPGGINLLQDFGYVAAVPNTIGGTLWKDCDGDGILDSDEAPRWAGIQIVLRDFAGNIVGTTVTDANGNYRFTRLPDGAYTVDVNDVGNRLLGYWASVGPTPGADNNSQRKPYAISVMNGQTNLTGDFGYYLVISELGDYLWYDINGNGLQDGGEPGLAGVKVTLRIRYPNGTEIAMHTVTDSSGRYRFANLLQDARYQATTLGNPATADLPRFQISVDVGQATLTGDGYVPTTVDVGNGSNDSRQHVGVFVQLALCGRSVVYDFGFSGGPLLAVIGNVEAFTRDGQTIVRWETIESWGTAGFWLDRLVGDEWVRVSPEMLPFPLFGVAPIVYEEVDPDAEAGRTYVYRLVEMENDGDILYYGPYTLTVDGPGRTYDDWAAAHFTAEELADPSIGSRDADSDGDRLTNGQEFLAGTDPRSADSVLQISEVRRVNGGFDLRWKSVAGRFYKIAVSDSMFGPFLPLEDFILATDESGNTTVSGDFSGHQMYFQVILVGGE